MCFFDGEKCEFKKRKRPYSKRINPTLFIGTPVYCPDILTFARWLPVYCYVMCVCISVNLLDLTTTKICLKFINSSLFFLVACKNMRRLTLWHSQAYTYTSQFFYIHLVLVSVIIHFSFMFLHLFLLFILRIRLFLLFHIHLPSRSVLRAPVTHLNVMLYLTRTINLYIYFISDFY